TRPPVLFARRFEPRSRSASPLLTTCLARSTLQSSAQAPAQMAGAAGAPVRADTAVAAARGVALEHGATVVGRGAATLIVAWIPERHAAAAIRPCAATARGGRHAGVWAAYGLTTIVDCLAALFAGARGVRRFRRAAAAVWFRASTAARGWRRAGIRAGHRAEAIVDRGPALYVGARGRERLIDAFVCVRDIAGAVSAWLVQGEDCTRRVHIVPGVLERSRQSTEERIVPENPGEPCPICPGGEDVGQVRAKERDAVALPRGDLVGSVVGEQDPTTQLPVRAVVRQKYRRICLVIWIGRNAVERVLEQRDAPRDLIKERTGITVALEVMFETPVRVWRIAQAVTHASRKRGVPAGEIVGSPHHLQGNEIRERFGDDALLG